MINANELRIGNLLEVAGNFWHVDSIVSVDTSTGFELYFKENDEYDHALNAEPIPLTEEWLLKFGFGINDQPSWIRYDIGEWFCMYKQKTNGRIILGALSDSAPNIYIEYVHQLQNIYFALTGEELRAKDAAYTAS